MLWNYIQQNSICIFDNFFHPIFMCECVRVFACVYLKPCQSTASAVKNKGKIRIVDSLISDICFSSDL